MTNEQKLAEAESALHSLVTGTMPKVIVDQNGERVEYTQANRAALERYIQQHKDLIAGSKKKPLRVWF